MASLLDPVERYSMSGSDDGLAIDDFSLTARGAVQGVPVGGSTVWMLGLGVVAIAIARRARLASP